MLLTRRGLAPAIVALSVALTIGTAHAQETIKVGIVAHFSGPFAVIGKQFREGIDAFQAVNGDMAGGKKVELIYRDVGGANPASAKQAVQELVVNDGVSVLGGFYLTPDAAASVPVVNETKVPAVLFNAAGRDLVNRSDYFIRISGTNYQTATPAAEWAYAQGHRTAYISVSDYAPGHDSLAAFKAKFTELGGEIVGEDVMALNTVDYAPFVERIAAAKPDVAFNFLPNGVPVLNFTKVFAARGLPAQGTHFLSLGLPDDIDLPKIGKDALGFHNSLYYAYTLDTPENKEFIAAIQKVLDNEEITTNPQAQAYDGMKVIYQLIESQAGGEFDGAAAVESIKGFSWVGPQGPMKIDPETRNIIQNMYIREVQEVDGQLRNVVVDTFTDVRDPGVEAQ